MVQKQLFKHPPLRRSNGRYCTKEQYRTDRVDSENKQLRYERDKYYRAWMAVASENEQLRRELIVLKSKIEEIANG